MNEMRSYPARYYVFGTLLALLLAVVVVIHTYFAGWLIDYVNDVLKHINGYTGSVESINIDLYRGAYRVNNLKLYKKEGSIPTPFLAAKTIDFSIQWRSLIHGRVVADAELVDPVINFAVSKTAEQEGGNVDWTRPIKKLSPVDINHVTFTNGTISYQDFSTTPKVDVYIHHMSGEISNLRNVLDKNQLLPSTVVVKGDSIGGGSLDIKGRMNILKQIPDMDLQSKLENVHLPALNTYSDAYGAFTFKDGSLNVYSEFIVDDSEVSGYVKPVATHIAIIDLHKTHNPIKIAWESLVAGVFTLFTNHMHDQFATKIPLQGDLKNVQTSTWAAIGGIFHNAFVSALSHSFDTDSDSMLRSGQKLGR